MMAPADDDCNVCWAARRTFLLPRSRNRPTVGSLQAGRSRILHRWSAMHGPDATSPASRLARQLLHDYGARIARDQVQCVGHRRSSRLGFLLRLRCHHLRGWRVSQHDHSAVNLLVFRRSRTWHADPVHDDLGIGSADQSVVRRVNGQERRPRRVMAFRIHHAAVVVGLDEEEKLQSRHETCLSGTAVKKPSNPRQVR